MKYTNLSQFVAGVIQVHEDLTQGERCFLSCLAVNGDYRTALSHPSMANLQLVCGTTRAGVHYIADKLIKRSLIEITEVGQGRRSTEYRIKTEDPRFLEPRQNVASSPDFTLQGNKRDVASSSDFTLDDSTESVASSEEGRSVKCGDRSVKWNGQKQAVASSSDLHTSTTHPKEHPQAHPACRVPESNRQEKEFTEKVREIGKHRNLILLPVPSWVSSAISKHGPQLTQWVIDWLTRRDDIRNAGKCWEWMREDFDEQWASRVSVEEIAAIEKAGSEQRLAELETLRKGRDYDE